MAEVQLFDVAGNLVTTVMTPWDSEIVVYNHKYYALRDGRYVECKCVAGYVDPPKSASLVGFSMRR